MGAKYPEEKQQTQLLPSRHVWSRPSLRGSRHSLARRSSRRVAQVTIVFVSLLGITYFLHPFTLDNSYADSDSTSFNASASVATNLSISASNVSMSATPEASGSWLSGSSTVNVSTNNATGYALYVSSSTNETNLVNSNNSSYTIANLSSATSESTFRSDSNLMNHYGFTHNNTGSDSESGQITSGTYLPVTTISNPRLIKTTTEKANTSETAVTFATKVDRSIPAGEYINTITFTAVANYVPPSVEYMQDLDASWCAEKTAITSSNSSSITDYTYEVVDSRTNEAYWVRKFGSLCWMVENLYMPSQQALTSSNTNMTASSYTLPTSSTSGFSDYTAANMYSSSRRRSSDSGNKDGSYFTWVAAKVGQNSTGTNNDVCPKNWRMPTYAEQQTVDTVSELGGSFNDFYADSTGAAIAPVLPGRYNDSSPYNAGSLAYWWSSTQRSSSNAYYLYSYTSSLSTSYSYDKNYGFSVRCVLPSS